MEDHVTGTGRGSGPTTAKEPAGAYPESHRDPRVLSDREKQPEKKQNEVSSLQTDGYLRNRIRKLEESERSLLLLLHRLAAASQTPSMQHSQRLDQRLYVLREEVRNMTRDKERGERVWRERLQRCQRQLRAKEEETGRQAAYFDSFKAQLQHKLCLARDREQGLQSRVYALEKQLLHMTVCAATGGVAHAHAAVRITGGTLTHRAEKENAKLPPTRGEGEGEEERKEERRKQWSAGTETENEAQRAEAKDAAESSGEARLRGFILSLQEDLRVLLEREEDGATERRRLTEQLQEAQEKGGALGSRLEEAEAQVEQLKMSESALMEELEELREEKLSDREAAHQAPSGVVPSNYEELGPFNLSAGPPGHHEMEAERSQNENQQSSAKTETPLQNHPLNLLNHRESTAIPGLQPLSMSEESYPGAWCSTGILEVEESHSEESNALRDAYMSLGFGEELRALQEQRERLEVALQLAQEQLLAMSGENTLLKSQLRKETERGAQAEQEPSRERTETTALHHSDGAEGNNSLAQDDLVQALNQENRALAERFQELLAHVELREEEMRSEEERLREQISTLGAERVRLEQEAHEQGSLIAELNKKTEDDLNAIMELQQRLAESLAVKEPYGSHSRGESNAATSGVFQQNSLDECVDSLVESVLEGEEPRVISDERPDDSTTASAPVSHRDTPGDPTQSGLQSSQHVGPRADQDSQLTRSIKSLNAEQEELSGRVSSLREQQREVASSVQTQTEVKQQLTRAVWGLKEERDSISRALSALKLEREQLSRTVCGLRDEKDQFLRSASALREEKEQLAQSLSGLRRANDELSECLSSGKEERDQIVQSLQGLRAEEEQLGKAVIGLEREREQLAESLGCLREQRDEEQSSRASPGDGGELTMSVRSLKEEEEKTERSVNRLKREEEQIRMLLRGLREEQHSLQAALSSQTQTQENSQKQHLPVPSSAVNTKKALDTGEYPSQKCLTDDPRENSVQEQRDLMREIEALGAELKMSQDELAKSYEDSKRLQGELCQSEARRAESERRADKVTRLADVAEQMEDTKRENESLATQVKELQNKLSALVREKRDAQSRKAQAEEQYNILTAQLKAKTVALEELNSEYISLKLGQSMKEGPHSALVSLRTRYNDIRAKYDALLKKRSQKDLDMAPLKAKLSCLVAKCQERNSLLVQMTKALRGVGGCVDATLTQQVDALLRDAALQEYAAAFAPGSGLKTREYTTGFTTAFISTFQDQSGGFTQDRTRSATSPLVNRQNGVVPESGVRSRVLKSNSQVSSVSVESMPNHQYCGGEVTTTPTVTQMENTDSPGEKRDFVQATPSPSPEPALKDSFINSTQQLSPSASGPVQFGLDMKGKRSPDLTGLTRPSIGRPPPSSSSRVGVSRRLSSPEKIINMHEQLQKTLRSCYQAPVIRGREEQPRKSVSFSTQANLSPASQTNKQSLGLNGQHTNSVPLIAAAVCQAKPTPTGATPPVATRTSKTLFNAVAARSANVTFSPDMFTHRPSKADITKTIVTASFPGKAKATSNNGPSLTISPEMTENVTDISDARHSPSSLVTTRWTSLNSDLLPSSDTNQKTTATNTTAPRTSTAPGGNHLNNRPLKADGADPEHDKLLFASSRTQSDRCFPEISRKSTSALKKIKEARAKPEAPAEVGSVEVIQTVGQSSLMIGWERPSLDELGCSNGTFVYGYRVFVRGDFHKSVMSSACTKCILENVDLSVPVDISVQTLGSNGLISNSVHTLYKSSVAADHH